MCPGGAACPDCGGTLCPCHFTAGPPPPPPAPRPLVPACQPPHDHYKFCDMTLPIEERVADLMTHIPDSVKPNLLTARGGPPGLQNLSHVSYATLLAAMLSSCRGSLSHSCGPGGRASVLLGDELPALRRRAVR